MTLVELIVILAFVLTVTLTLDLASVGVLPTLLFITVASFCPRRPPTIVVPLLGRMFVTIWLMFVLPLTVLVACRPLFASTTILTFTRRSLPIVRVELPPTILVVVTTFKKTLPCLKKTGAPFLFFNVWESLATLRGTLVSAETQALDLLRTALLLTTVVRLPFVRIWNLEALPGSTFSLLVPLIMVWVRGRLDPYLSEHVKRRSLLLATRFVGQTLAILGPFLAMALAPLSVMTRTPFVPLRDLSAPKRTLPPVFMLSLITTVMGAVNFSV